jgi:TetR/AcrR family transcriptional repressor of nem operon
MSRKNDKRLRLVEAADELIYQQTFNSTTLADIASRADVPLGNVYYYFKTKDEILKAVVQKRELELQTLFTTWDQLPNVKDRLRSYIAQSIEGSDTIARFGCTLGSLCQELGKHSGDIAALGSALMRKSLSWVETQFKALGKGERSLTLAEYLIANIQGASLVTLTFKDPKFLQKQSKNLELWLESA